MPADLLSYFEQRFEKDKIKSKKSGSFITISRQTGCNGTGVAQDLVKALKALNLSWKYINKEILEESANKLKLFPAQINYVFESKKMTHADEVLAAFSNKYYKNDKVVRKTISEVLQHYALSGNVILVGRAGVATTQKLPGGLHIRLIAPYEWRMNSLKKRKEFEDQDVAAFIKLHDQKKKKLIEDFSKKDISEIEFDLTINCAAFNRQQVIELLISSMKMKKLI
jgi:cytidylate kinase